jgi:nucleotide-binding universal stress UspA family protein
MQLARIVIGVDLTKSSTEAALWAALRFAPEARVILLHCVSPLLPDERIAEEHARAEEYLGYLAKRIGVSRCTIAIRLGEPARTIAELAEEMDADLVAVGTHEDHPDREPSLGGTAERLVRCSAAPVLLCGEHRSRAPRSVLLPLDSADVSWSVAEWTGAIASRFDARVVLVHIEAPHGIGSTKRAFLHMQPREEATTPWTRVAR